ncbi:hypothetical protein K7432_012453 [Basidiobolus ranarum]|uniref:Uncharacterized protein n=1 Tax=Basidiobolus ranarum TaxID=34480 RepID=A0ABR2WKZ1_9FUNG
MTQMKLALPLLPSTSLDMPWSLLFFSSPYGFGSVRLEMASKQANMEGELFYEKNQPDTHNIRILVLSTPIKRSLGYDKADIISEDEGGSTRTVE